jgi:hypothetical protein
MATSRTDRDLARGRRAAARVRVRGGSALAAACAHIEATFSPAMQHSILKDRVAALIRRGAAHPDVWLRYRLFVERHPITNLDAAIILVGRMRCAELEARAATVRSWGHCNRSRLTLMMLDEVCLILRMVRKHAPTCFTGLMMEIQAADLTTSAWGITRVGAAE